MGLRLLRSHDQSRNVVVLPSAPHEGIDGGNQSLNATAAVLPMEEPRRRRAGRPKKGAPKKPVEPNFRIPIALRSKRPDLKMELLCRGAPEMWNLLGGRLHPQFSNDFYGLVDLQHLMQKLGAAARVIDGSTAG
jgi:hypothetical protein